MQQKKVRVFYYDITPVNLKEFDTLEKICKATFSKEDTFDYKNEAYKITVLDQSDNGVFGHITKNKELSEYMLHVKKKDTEEEIDPSKHYLEFYTYFYIDYEKRLLSIIYNNRFSSIEEFFKQYFLRKIDMLAVHINPVIDSKEKIIEYFKDLSNTMKFEARFSTKYCQELQNLSGQIFDLPGITSVSIKGKLHDLKNIPDTYKYQKFEITNSTSNEVIDVIKYSLTSFSEINTSLIISSNFEEVKKAMINYPPFLLKTIR